MKKISPRQKEIVDLIPEYPEEIGISIISKTTGLPANAVNALLSTPVCEEFLICQEGRFLSKLSLKEV